MSMGDFISTHQGWVLATLGSAMGILGASTIYTDLVVRLFNRKSTFSIKKNEKFLIYGFSLSSGSLLLTALYKLLPEAYSYFTKSTVLEGLGSQGSVLVYFSAGVVGFIVFNELVHYFTSESLVHCSHGGEHGHGHGAGDEHAHSHDRLDHSHDHSHSHSSSSDEDDKYHTHTHSDEEAAIAYPIPQTVTEATPLLDSPIRPALVTKKSILEVAFGKLQQHECTGINDQNCDGDPVCIAKELTYKVSSDIHNLDFYRELQVKTSKSSLVAYTHHPVVVEGAVPDSPLRLPQLANAQLPSEIMLSSEPNLDLHTTHTDDHHHKVHTPISKLLSIGIQTCLALTLHKLPEGFIMYATSKADPELGLSIFLSLAMHNIVEGFTMTLPLYLALDSRMKAFSISFVLCGFSQPVGALLAYIWLHGEDLDENTSSYGFGALISVTAGFLLIIALQMFASAIQFGGSGSQVIKWTVVGMLIILLCSSLTEYGRT